MKHICIYNFNFALGNWKSFLKSEETVDNTLLRKREMLELEKWLGGEEH